MARPRSSFLCSACGFPSPKWGGQCPQCQAWGTLEEQELLAETANKPRGPLALAAVYGEVPTQASPRFSSGIAELDRVLGGGLVPGSVLLIGGEPGVGKSTLLLQVAARLAETRRVLYASGEESAVQIRLRGERLGLGLPVFWLAHETRLEAILELLDRTQPELLIVDSIQTTAAQDLASPAGTISQVRHCTQVLLDLAKPKGMVVLLVGHITKEGALAGPKSLEHMVDGVFLFEGERSGDLRMIRAQKNRFGPGGELGVFRMMPHGLEVVEDPSALLLQNRPARMAGSIVVPCLEGTRVFLVEVQVLTGTTHFPSPRRLAMGLDLNRLALVVAILERKLGCSLQGLDIYANVVGGMAVREPALDLGLALALTSSFRNLPLPPGLAAFGELGLAGEIRPVARPAARLRECARFGLNTVLLPTPTREDGTCNPQQGDALTRLPVKDLAQALDHLQGC